MNAIMTLDNQAASDEAKRKAGFAEPSGSAWWKVVYNSTDGTKGKCQLVHGSKGDALNVFGANREARYLVALEEMPNEKAHLQPPKVEVERKTK